MRILVCIPHFFNPQGRSRHGSTQAQPDARARALSASLIALHGHFGGSQRLIQIVSREAVPANQESAAQLDVFICTTGEAHLLNTLPLPKGFYHHHPTQAHPPLLGFECHNLLRENIGSYDYYGYMEDDLILHDSWFFHKLAWFNQQVGDKSLLQPNRYELGASPSFVKVYIDGDLPPRLTGPYRRPGAQSTLPATVMGAPLQFQRPLNPHSGCFFLNAAQMQTWSQQPHFWDRRTTFVGPLESAATLSILQTFHIYKSAPQNANFLEIQHAGTAFLSLLGGQISLSGDAPS
jgi:hypothetical protein